MAAGVRQANVWFFFSSVFFVFFSSVSRDHGTTKRLKRCTGHTLPVWVWVYEQIINRERALDSQASMLKSWSGNSSEF